MAERVPLVTSNYVFAETHTALLVRTGRDEAIEWGRRFHAGDAIELIRVEESAEENAWSILETHTDKHWSNEDGRWIWHWDPEILTQARPLIQNQAQLSERLTTAATRLRQPCLLVRGADSDVLTTSIAREFTELAANATLTEVPHAATWSPATTTTPSLQRSAHRSTRLR